MAKMFSVFIFFAVFSHSRSFNIDVNVPVVRQGDQLGSYFGFSVAQYQFESRSDGLKNWLIVGAPKANVSVMLTEGIVNPGAVYNCDLEKPSCEQIPFDTAGNSKNVFDKPMEDKSNQWFGVAVSAVKGSVLACAHRYLYKTQQSNYHMYPGRCFSNKGDLKLSRLMEEYDACKVENDRDATGKTEKIDIASYVRYKYCQMGVSAVFEPNSNAALLGAPGSMNYQGSIFYEKKVRFKEPIKTEMANKSSPLGYQGFSTATGSFFKPNQIDVVTGAPRYNHHGMVVVFESAGSADAPSYSPSKVILPNGEDQLQPGSGFGYSVAGVDVNNDSLTDILVGAPYYSVKDSPNEGRVFVYMNKGNGKFVRELDLAPSLTRRMAQFGHVVARVGDLDQDGYEDVAIGAPYEDSQGVVYIFNGSANGLSKQPAQIIKASEVANNLKTFGYSLSGRFDMDGNGYPDTLIGAYESDSVILLRSRPIIDIKSEIQITPNPFDIRSKNCSRNYKGKVINTACMTIKVCLGYRERKDRLKEKLSMDLTMESDTKYVHQSRTKKEARVLFSATKGPYYNKTLNNLPPHPDWDCFIEEVFLRDNVQDIFPDITFKVNYKMHQPSTPPTAAPGTALPSLAGYAMLEEHGKTFSTAVLEFKRDCVKCEPNLHLKSKSPPSLAVGELDYELDVTISNSGESAYNTELFVTIPEGVSQSDVKDATDSKKQAYSISHKVTKETLGDNSTRLAIEVANPLKTSETKQVIIQLSTGSFSKSQDFLPIMINVTSSNPEQKKYMHDNVVHLNVTIVSKADLEVSGSAKDEQIPYGGTVLGESAMVTEDQIGSEVRHTYLVQNLGPDLVPEAEIVIQWPYEAESGKHLLYLVEVVVRGRGVCDFLPDQINPLHLLREVKAQQSSQNGTGSQGTIVRRRRDVRSGRELKDDAKDKRQIAQPVKTKPSTELDCKIGTARCTPIRCTMKKLREKEEVSFVVRSRIWNGTLLEDYYGKQVEVISRANVSSSVSFVQEENFKNNMAEISTQFNPDFRLPPSKKLASWVIPVAVVGAILALAIIVLILWKLGFFKRKKFDGNITDAEREDMMADSRQEKKPFDT